MEEETNQLTGNLRVSKLVEFLIAVFITIVVWNLPAQTFGIDGLTICAAESHSYFCICHLYVADRSRSGMGNIARHNYVDAANNVKP